MIRVLIIVFFASIIVFGAVNLISCSNADNQNSSVDIPENIKRAADSLIIVKTGQDYFEEYITHDPEETKVIPHGFFMAYRFYIPQKPYIDERITFVLDSTGILRPDMEVTGIPDCAESPDNCLFIVDEKEARKIAEEAGLPKGIDEWGAEFMWSAQSGKYVWHIISTLEKRGGPDGFRGNGREMAIDPNTGEVIKDSEWNIR